jgi:hypothetical protein
MAALLLVLVLLGVSIDTTQHFKSDKTSQVTPVTTDLKTDVTPASEAKAS